MKRFRSFLARFKIRRQFMIRLHSFDGQYHNFFAYGGIDRVLERARLVERFDFGNENCVLVFEELPPEP